MHLFSATLPQKIFLHLICEEETFCRLISSPTLNHLTHDHHNIPTMKEEKKKTTYARQSNILCSLMDGESVFKNANACPFRNRILSRCFIISVIDIATNIVSYEND